MQYKLIICNCFYFEKYAALGLLRATELQARLHGLAGFLDEAKACCCPSLEVQGFSLLSGM